MKNIKEILVFDFETSGLSAINDDIIEIGAVKLKNIEGTFIETEALEILVKPKGKLPLKITEITGITDTMIDNQGVSQEEAFQRFSSMINDETLLIAYNIQFDLGFMQELYRRHFSRSFNINNNVLDVMAVYKDRHKFPHRLESAIEKYNINIPNSHRAADDARATYAVLMAMGQERNTIGKYINVVGYNAKYGLSGPKLKHVKYVPLQWRDTAINKLEKL